MVWLVIRYLGARAIRPLYQKREASVSSIPGLHGKSFLPMFGLLRADIALASFLNFLLSDVEFGAGNSHGQHHLFFGALAFHFSGNFSLPLQLNLMFAVAGDAKNRGQQNHGHRARHRPLH